jgi:hypothetical protein
MPGSSKLTHGGARTNRRIGKPPIDSHIVGMNSSYDDRASGGDR